MIGVTASSYQGRFEGRVFTDDRLLRRCHSGSVGVVRASEQDSAAAGDSSRAGAVASRAEPADAGLAAGSDVGEAVLSTPDPAAARRFTPAMMLGLQGSAGNRAVAGLFAARSPAADADAAAPASQPARDAQQEVVQQAPSVQAPTVDDVTEPAPSEQIQQQGTAAVQTLSQVAARASAPPPPAAPPYLAEPAPAESGPAPVADDTAQAAADQAVSQAGVAQAAAEQSGADLAAASTAAASLAGTRVQFDTADSSAADGDADVGADAEQSAAASDLVSSFLTGLADRANVVTGLGAAAQDRYRAAADAAVALINAGVEERLQAITGHVDGLRAQAQVQAEAAVAAVTERHTAAQAAITAATADARLGLEAEYTTATQQIEALESGQLQALDRLYQAGDQRFRAAGQTVGAEAEHLGGSMAEEYMRGLVDEDDSFMDGPLTYNRGKARADTAHEISKAYQSGLADEANKQADQALQGKARDIESVHGTAAHAREALRQLHTATLDSIEQADATARQQADAAHTSLLDGINQALIGGQAMFDGLQASLAENVRTAARARVMAVQQQAGELTGTTQDQVAQTVNSLTEIGKGVAAQAQGAKAPSVQALSASLSAASAQLDAGVADFQAQCEAGMAAGEQQLAACGQEAADGLAGSVQDGLDGVTASAAELGAAIQQIADSADGTFGAVEQHHGEAMTQATGSAQAGFDQTLAGVRQADEAMAHGLEQGFDRSAAGLEQGLRGALPKMQDEIRTKAEENADAVPPRWKSVVKWVLIIAVIVVVALVIGPFVIGAVGAALGTGAVMTGIIAGAIVGAATGATIQVINNWASNRPLGEGVVRAAIIGGIGGAVGGGFGAYFSSAAQAGTTVVNTAFRQFLANSAINVAADTVMNVVTTGHFTWQALGMSVLSAVAVGGAMHAAGGLSGVQGIQEASLGAGEGFGGAVRSGFGGVASGFGGASETSAGTSSGTSSTSSAPVVDESVPPPSPVADESVPPAPSSDTPPERKAWVHPDDADEGHYHPLDDVPAEEGQGSGMSRTDRLRSYSNAVKDPAGGNPATAAAEGDEFGGPAIRDNLYSGKAHGRMVKQLQEQGILEVLPDDRIRITDPDRYLDFIERSYFEQAGSHLDPRMRAAIAEHIGSGGGTVNTVGVDPQTGGNSFGGMLPGTHAELIALNDILARGGTGPIDLATLRTTGDAVHFIACPHCRAIINILSKEVPINVSTGMSTPRP